MTEPATRQHLTELLQPLLSAGHATTGTAVAVRQGEHELVLVSGAISHRSPQPIQPDTRFEIGSLTKTFTALLLAEMAANGEVNYDDPIDRYLPLRYTWPTPITLLHLATHSSGLPRLPLRLWPSAALSWHTNPYRALSPHKVADALNRARPRTTPGTRVRYSNFGVGLLGQALANAAGRSYQDLLSERILRPLKLTDTGCATTPQATGHWYTRPRPPFEIPGLPAAGALRSSARDMLRYLTAHLTPHTTPLPTALTDVVRPRIVVAGTDDRICLVWNQHRRMAGHDLFFHCGSTRGFTSFAGFSPQTQTALAVMTNTAPTPRDKFIQRSYDALHTLASTHHT